MKIRRLEIERFGHWHDVAVSLAPRGLTVLYGPNETGKSSLVRFIRGMLYGFRPEDELGSGARPRFAACAGELLLEAGNDELTLRRSSGGEGHAELRRAGPLSIDATPTLLHLLGGINREVYERVFAVGLGELQELATLSGEDVARHVYETSLGDEGERVMHALRRAEQDRNIMLGPTSGSEGLPHWQEALRRIDAQIAECAAADVRMSSLELDRERLQSQLADQEWRRNGLREQLRGHAFLERVWGPWNRQRKLQLELELLPEVNGFPEDGTARLREIEGEIADLRRRRDRIRENRQRIAEQRRSVSGSAPVGRRLDEIGRLLRDAETLRSSESQLPGLRSRIDTARRQLDERLRQLGPGWSESRLERVDPGVAAAVKLFRQADRYRMAARHRSRAIRSYRRVATQLQREQSELAAALRNFSGADLRDAEEQVRSELQDVAELQRLEARHSATLQMLETVREESQAADARRNLPQHFYPVLAALAMAGAGLVIAGIWRFATGGSVHAGLVGAIFALLGICCAGITWTIKERFEPNGADADRWQRRQRELQTERDNLEREMQQLAGSPPDDDEAEFDGDLRISGRDGVDDISDVDEMAERFDTLTSQLADLGVANRREAELPERRNELARRRERIRLLQRTVSQARRDWCLALREAGLDESVRVATSLQTWEAVHGARRTQQDLQEWQSAAQGIEQALHEFSERVMRLAAELEADADAVGVTETLSRWRAMLDVAAQDTAHRIAIRQEWRAARAESRAVRRRWRELAAARRELFRCVGVANRNAFLRLDAAWRRRAELTSLLEDASDDVADAAASEPELAIVEDDLLQYDAGGNREAIETIETELSDLENDLRADHERLGRVEQELEALQQDRTLTALRFERAQADHELRRVVEQLCGIELAVRGLEELREQLEAERQPATLRSAAHYLSHLTAGKYRRVWAPLGEQSLVVDDDVRQAYRVDQLSSGTREQLFLAIRLALIDDFIRQGTELPIVLDDVFVNFDQRRTEAAVRTVVDYAADGRQLLLLTCHQHLVRLFEAAGASTVRLPEPGELADRRRVG